MFVTVHIERKDSDEPIVAQALRRSIQQSLPDGTPVVVHVSTAETVGLEAHPDDPVGYLPDAP